MRHQRRHRRYRRPFPQPVPQRFLPVPLAHVPHYRPPNLVPIVQYPQPPVYEHMIDPAVYHPMPANRWAHTVPDFEPMQSIEDYDDVDAFMDMLDAELDGDEGLYDDEDLDLYGYMDLYGADEKERKRPFKKILSLFKKKEGDTEAPIDKITKLAETVMVQPKVLPQAVQSASAAAAEEFERAAPKPPPSAGKKALVITGIALGSIVVIGGAVLVGKKLAS